MVHDGIALAGGILQCTGIGCGVQWHALECGDTWWYAMAHDAPQRTLGALPPRKLMDRDIRCDIGCKSSMIIEDIVENLGTPCLAETDLRWGYQ